MADEALIYRVSARKKLVENRAAECLPREKTEDGDEENHAHYKKLGGGGKFFFVFAVIFHKVLKSIFLKSIFLKSIFRSSRKFDF